MPGKKPKPWTRADLAQLGRVPDSVLARRAERTIQAVVAEREWRRIGLPASPRRWTAREIKLIGQFNDAELARRLRRPYKEVRKQRLDLHLRPFKPKSSSQAPVWFNSLHFTMSDPKSVVGKRPWVSTKPGEVQRLLYHSSKTRQHPSAA